MRRPGPCTTSGVRLLAATFVLAACSGGCLTQWVGSAGRDEPVTFQDAPRSFSTERSFSLPAADPSRKEGGILSAFEEQAGRLAHALAHRDETNPILERIASRQVEDVYALADDSATTDGARREFMRFARKAFSEAVRRQGAYLQVRGALRESVGGNPFTPLAANPLFEDPREDHAGGATRLFPDGAGLDLFPVPDPSDFETHVNVGVRPSLGVSWMRFYRFSWNPTEGEMVHRLEYRVGVVGVGAAYRIVDGTAADAGLGLQFGVGRSLVTVSASQALHGADDGQVPGEQQVMVGMAWRF
jgi:hypothetical protein